MPSAADLTPEEVAAALAARARRSAVEDEIPASLAARLDREVAARVDAELAARGEKSAKKERTGDGRALGIISVIFGVPLMGIVEGTSHGSIGGAFAVMGGIVLVNLANALGRRRD
ncbi:hypothetical protein [Actinospica robiniae]|uniref:hypothetical protein n=1 Tax=Actinospica robiniae TaxID=304901 RepID=UPI0003F77932|nr:hypothetical protein [Actinospica robiniae]